MLELDSAYSSVLVGDILCALVNNWIYQMAVGGDRLLLLCDLISSWQIGIKVMLALEIRSSIDTTVECKSGE